MAGCVPDIQATYLFEREEDTSAGQRLHLGIKDEDKKILPLKSREERSNVDSSEKVKVNDYKTQAKSIREERSNRDSSSEKVKITGCKTSLDPQQSTCLPKIKFEPTAKREKEEYLGQKSFIFENSKGKVAESSVPITNSKTSPKLKQALGPFLCEVCSKTFKSNKILKIHMLLHGEKTDICDVCSKAFANKYHLKEHVLTHTQQKLQCQICFASVLLLKKHMRDKHGERKRVTCSKCGAAVKKIWNHEKICKMTEEERATYREGLKVKCEMCFKVLADKVKLARHKTSAHSKEKLIQCKFCDHKDSRSDNMKTHLRNNHSQAKYPQAEWHRLLKHSHLT